MLRMILVSLALLPLAAPAAAKPETIVLEPSSPWQVDFGEHRCRLGRAFGSGENLSIFYIEQWSPGETVEWGLAGKVMRRFNASREVEFEFQGGERGSFKFVNATFGDTGALVTTKSRLTPIQRVRRMGLPEIDAGDAGVITALRVSQGDKTVVANFGKLAEPIKVLNHCMTNLVAHWGVDLAEQQRIATPAQPIDMERAVAAIMREYPVGAANTGAQANFQVILIVEADGSISKCDVTNRTLASTFKFSRGPCEAFTKYARFAPAKAVDGTPVQSFFSQEIAYRMPS